MKHIQKKGWEVRIDVAIGEFLISDIITTKETDKFVYIERIDGKRTPQKKVEKQILIENLGNFEYNTYDNETAHIFKGGISYTRIGDLKLYYIFDKEILDFVLTILKKETLNKINNMKTIIEKIDIKQ